MVCVRGGGELGVCFVRFGGWAACGAARHGAALLLKCIAGVQRHQVLKFSGVAKHHAELGVVCSAVWGVPPLLLACLDE